MRRRPFHYPRTSVATLVMLLTACQSTVTDPGSESTVAFVEISPLVGRVVDVEDSLSFTATATFDDGRRVPADATWSSGDAGVARIGADGWAVAVSPGVTTIEAVVAGVTGRGALIVNPDTVPPRVTDVFVQPNRVSVFQRSELVLLSAEFEDMESGTKAALAVFSGPGGAGITGLVTMAEVPDTTSMGTAVRRFEGFLEIPATVGAGIWVLSVLRADDRAGNVARWGASDLEARGFDVRVLATLTSNEE